MSSGPRSSTDQLTYGSLVIEYDERVLRPRPWTTHQADWGAELLGGAPPGPVLELCAGAGQIGLLTVASSGRDLVSVDVDPVACEFARRNADTNGMGHRVEVRCGDLREVVRPEERFALIVADPPYLGPEDVARYPEDPLVAIDGGPDGLVVAWSCVDVIGRHLMPGGRALLQLQDTDQAHRIRDGLPPRGALALTDYRTRGRGLIALLERS
ncbi:MAG: methyltransferase [Nocardioides sp.]